MSRAIEGMKILRVQTMKQKVVVVNNNNLGSNSEGVVKKSDRSKNIDSTKYGSFEYDIPVHSYSV
jgi:hypothetical protein